MQNLHCGKVNLLHDHVEGGAVPGGAIQQQQAGLGQKGKHAVTDGKPAGDFGAERFDGCRKKIHRGILTLYKTLVTSTVLAPSDDRPYSFEPGRRRNMMKTSLIPAVALVLCVAW